MKITHTILALLAAGLIGPAAFGDNNGQPLGLAVIQDGHGGSHILYYQGSADSTSVALSTGAGGVGAAMGPLQTQDRPLPDQGNVRYVVGTNQHGTPNAAYIPVSSHFQPAGQ